MLRYSNHARKRLTERKVTEEEAEAVVADPAVTYSDVKGNSCYMGEINGKSLRVVIAADDPEFVITVIDRSEET